MHSSLDDLRLRGLLEGLHAQSAAQTAQIDEDCAQRACNAKIDFSTFDDGMHRFFADKLVALDRDKAEFCYQLCRSIGTTRIVEAGASFWVSTIYLFERH